MELLGVFAETFGIRPWEYDLLTVDEVSRLVQWLTERSEDRAPEGK